MANTDNPHGFRPIRAISGKHGQINSYSLAAANTKLGIGDIVAIQADGTVDAAAASTTTGIGVAAEAKDASAGGTILVYDNPGQVYEAQTDNGTGTLTAAAGINLNADIIATTATGTLSLMEIDEDSGNTTNTLPLKVLRLYSVSDNAHGEFNRLEVIINNHVLSGGPGAAGL